MLRVGQKGFLKGPGAKKSSEKMEGEGGGGYTWVRVKEGIHGGGEKGV